MGIPEARRAFEPKLSLLEGAEAIYQEDSNYALVRLKNIEANEWGVKGIAELIADLASGRPADRPLPSEWGISAAWIAFSFGANEWHAHYTNWHVYLDKELVRAVKAEELDALPVPVRRIQLNRLIANTRRPPP